MQQRFDGFLDYVCGDIISKRERENARNELYDHLMCTYECNLARGMDEEHATIEAENSMGDRNAIRAQLEQVHASFPERRFKSALALVIAGFFFASFQISLLSGMDILIKLFGQSLMIAGIFCLRKAHRKLGVAFAAIMGQYIFSGASTVLTPIAEAHPLPILILSLLGTICGAAFWILFVGGLIDLTRGRKGAKALYLPLCAVSNVFLYALNGGTYIYMYIIGTTSLNADNAPIFVLIAMSLVILNMIITIAVLRRANKFLYESGHEYEAESSGLKKGAVMLCAFALVLAACAGFDAYRLTRKAEVEPYSTADIAIDADERARIETILAGYGVPERYLKLLPNSEIMRFRSAASVDKLSWKSNSNIDSAKEFQNARDSDGKLIYNFSSFEVFADHMLYYFEDYSYCVTDTDGKKHMLCCIELKDIEPLSGSSGINNYVDCIELEESNSNISQIYECICRSNDSLFILTDEDGQTVINKPLSLNRTTDSLGNTTIANAEFQCKPGMKIFYIADFSPEEKEYPVYDAVFNIAYIHRNRPILWISERTPEAQISSQTAKDFCSFRYALNRIYIPYLKSEDPFVPTTEPEEETTERVIHGNSIEEMAAS